MKQKYLLLLLLLLAVTGCKDDSSETPEEVENPEVELPLGYTALEITEVLDNDAQTVTSTQIYTYNETGQLRSCLQRQTTTGVGAILIERNTEVTYDGQTVRMADDEGNVLTYTLDAEGRATACTSETPAGQVRHYAFGYVRLPSGKHLLTQLTETLDDAATPYAEISIDYTQPETPVVTRRVDGDAQSLTLSLPAGGGTANQAQLPCLFLEELYPLSLHKTALYAHLLGDATDVLIARCEPEDNEESGEFTTYTYETDEDGRVQSCRVVTKSYGSTYFRTLDYTFLP